MGFISWRDYNNPRSLVNRLRRQRGCLLKRLIQSCHARAGRVRIIDLGGTQRYWAMLGSDYFAAMNVTVTIVNQISPSASRPDGRFAHVMGDACDLSQYADMSFDLVHSNSVIEHVGSWVNMEAFAREVCRLAPAYYVQTPYFWFPIEPHFLMPFFHWMPESWRVKLAMRIPIGNVRKKYPTVRAATRRIQGAQLLDLSQMRALFPDARTRFEWFGPLPKSIYSIRVAPTSD